MKRVEQEKTVTYIIDEENRTVKAVIRNLKWDALNTIFRLFIREDINFRFSPDIVLNNTYSATAKCSEKDEFDVEKGKLIARRKAIIKYNKAKVAKMQKVYEKLSKVETSLKATIEYTIKKYEKFEDELKNY